MKTHLIIKQWAKIVNRPLPTTSPIWMLVDQDYLVSLAEIRSVMPKESRNRAIDLKQYLNRKIKTKELPAVKLDGFHNSVWLSDVVLILLQRYTAYEVKEGINALFAN